MSKYTVVIDPGHVSKYNKGVIVGYYEGDIVWKIAQYLTEELKEYRDVEVLCTKEHIDDNSLNAYHRGEYAATLKGRETVVFLSLHTNAISGDNVEKISGTAVFRSIYREKAHELGEKLAEAIANVLKKYTSVAYSRGCLAWRHPDYKNFDYHYVTRGTVLNSGNQEDADKSAVDYGYIIEHGFHTNPEECAAMMKDEVQREFAKVEAQTLAEYFGWVKENTPQPDIPVSGQPKTKIYRVQVGAYTYKSNAEAMLEKLKQNGFEGFILETTK